MIATAVKFDDSSGFGIVCMFKHQKLNVCAVLGKDAEVGTFSRNRCAERETLTGFLGACGGVFLRYRKEVLHHSSSLQRSVSIYFAGATRFIDANQARWYRTGAEFAAAEFAAIDIRIRIPEGGAGYGTVRHGSTAGG